MSKDLLKNWDWCRCGGKGYWIEQIDGVNTRRVECPRHWMKNYE